MKRSVLISVLALLGLQSPGNLNHRNKHLINITPCEALCVTLKSYSSIKLSVPDKFKSKYQHALSPLQSKHQKLPTASINTSVILLTEAPTIKLFSRSLSLSRRKNNKHKTLLLNRFYNDIKVPP